MTEIERLLRKIGLTEYEAKVYLTLMNRHLDGAVKLSLESKVPRTRIYSVLESLAKKGWVRVYSGYPLLFKPNHPEEIFDTLKEDYSKFLDSISIKIKKELGFMNEKFVVSNYNIGLKNLIEEIEKAKTVWISNATTEFLNEIENWLDKEAEIKVTIYPGEKGINRPDITWKESQVAVVNMVKGKETPSMSIILDEERIFTAFKDPTNLKWMITEMLYDDCTNCFREWNLLGWMSSEEGS